MKINIKELAKEVEKIALEKGFTSIEPSPSLIKIHADDEHRSFVDFVLRKGNNFSGRARVLVKNKNAKTQEVEQLSGIEFYN